MYRSGLPLVPHFHSMRCASFFAFVLAMALDGPIMAKVKVMVDIGEWSGFGGP